MDSVTQHLEETALARFLELVRVNTTSNEKTRADDRPSTEGQMAGLRLVQSWLPDLGFQNIVVDPRGFLVAMLPARPGYEEMEPIGFGAHIDTSADVPGDVNPIIHRNYRGGVITYPAKPDLVLDPASCKALAGVIGHDVVTSDGTTLLGADDKSGIVVCLAAFSALRQFTSLPHGPICFFVLSDEEIGVVGASKIPTDMLPKVCYTLDGGLPGEVECECWNASRLDLTFNGRPHHPGYGKEGGLTNAAEILGRFIGMLSEAHTPAHTAGRDGFVHVHECSGNMAKATLALLVRDFDRDGLSRREQEIAQLVTLLHTRYPHLKIEVARTDQYANMRQALDTRPEVLARAIAAIKSAGLSPIQKEIRGGTDGSKLTERGVLTPNLGSGQANIHSAREFTTVQWMGQCAAVVLETASNWAEPA